MKHLNLSAGMNKNLNFFFFMVNFMKLIMCSIELALLNERRVARGLKPLTMAQVLLGHRSVEMLPQDMESKPQRFASSNVPAPTPSQWRQVYAWLKKNAWKTSKYYFFKQSLKREGFTLVGRERHMRSLWKDLHEPKKVVKPFTWPSPSVGKVVPTSTRIQRVWKAERRAARLARCAAQELESGLVSTPIVVKERSSVLLKRIRLLRKALRQGHPMAYYYAIRDMVKGQVTQFNGVNFEMPLMETDEAGTSQVRHVGDSVMQTHDVPIEVSEPANTPTVAALSTNDDPTMVQKMTFRRILVETFTWKADKAQDTLLKEYKLPKDVLTQEIMQSPQFLPLACHAYFRPEYITLEFRVNSSRFSVGQLQVSCYFDSKYDSLAEHRSNIYSRSQMLNTLIDAGSSNSVIFKVPFKHFNPWYPMTKTFSGLDIHSVQVRVIAPYATPDGQADFCDISVFVTFENVQMSGLRSMSAIKSGLGEMFPLLATAAMQYLNQRNADRNRDKPPLQQSATLVEPRATSCLALGTNCVEPIQPLRLDARGQVPHPVVGDFEFDVPTIAGNFGLLKTIEWKKDQQAGTKLWSMDAGPLLDITQYPNCEVKDGDVKRVAYMMPPCAVLASCFNVFSGSVKLRFDIVGSFAHTGSLIVCFVPGVCDSTDILLKDAKAAYTATFDIHEQRSFEYQVPYVADKPWWPVNRLDLEDTNRIACYGRVWLYVLNALVPMDNVPSNVQINIYVAGGTDLSFAVPVQSQLSLPWYLTSATPPNDHEVRARDTYYPYYVGTWRWLMGGTKGALLRYGAVSDHIAQFSKLKSHSGDKWVYYESQDPNLTFTDSNKKQWKNTELALIPLDVSDGYGLIYMAVADKNALASFFPKPWTKDARPNWSAYTWYAVSDVTALYSNGNPSLQERLYTAPKEELTDEEYEKVGVPQIDNRDAQGPVMVGVGTLNSSRTMLTFGESFQNLKDLLRRYEVSGSVDITIDSHRSVFQNDLVFFVLPQGNKFDVSTNLVQSVGRDGNRCLLLACARHMLGSVNIKLVTTAPFGMVWAQHKPDRSIEYLGLKNAPRDLGDVTYLHGYGSAITSCSVNPTLTVNVPYYNPNSLILLQKPNLAADAAARRAMSLGEVSAGMICTLDSNVTFPLIIYQSIGDDFSPYNFVGWPPLVPQYIYNKYSAVGTPEMPTIKVQADEKQLDLITSYIKEMADGAVKSVFGETVARASKAASIALYITTALPSNSKLSWLSATLGVLVQLGLFKDFNAAEMLSSVTACFSGNESQQPSRNIALSGTTQAPIKEEELQRWVKFATLAWQGLAITLNINARGKPPTLRAFAERFMDAAKSQAVATRGFLAFFQNIFEVIQDFIVYLVHWWSPSLQSLSDLQTNAIIVDTFVTQALEMEKLLAANTPRTQVLANKLDALCAIGDEITILALNNPKVFPQPTWNIIAASLTKLKKERLCLLKEGITAVSRYTPFVVYFFGEPGIGKSEATTTFAADLIKVMGIKSVNPIYCKPPSSCYFTGLTPEHEIIVVDDFEAFRHTNTEVSDAATLMQLKSSAPYNPPMAAVEDKPLLITPKVVFINANTGWPQLSHITNKEALLRRRDLLFEVKLKPGCKMPETAVDQEHLTFDHLEYYIHDKFQPNKQSGPYTYAQVKETISKVAAKYHANEQRLLAMRIKRITDVTLKEDLNPHTVKKAIVDQIDDKIARINADYQELQNVCGKSYFQKMMARTKRTLGLIEKPKPSDTTTFKQMVELMNGDADIPASVKKLQEDVAKTAASVIETTAEIHAEPEDPLSGIDAAIAKYVSFDTTGLEGSGQMAPPRVSYSPALIETPDGALPTLSTVEVGQPALHDQVEEVAKHNWHWRLGTKTCKHSNPQIFHTCPHPESRELRGIIDKDDKYSFFKCADYCIADENWFYDAFYNRFSMLPFVTLKLTCAQLTGTILDNRPPPTSFKSQVLKLYRAALDGLGSSIKFIFKVLRIVLRVVIPILAIIAAIWGACTGIGAVARYCSRENVDESGMKVNSFGTCFYDEWQDNVELMREDAKQMRTLRDTYVDTLTAIKDASKAQEIYMKAQYIGGGENPAYEPKQPKPQQQNNVPTIASISGKPQMGLARNINLNIKRSTVWLYVEGQHCVTNEIVMRKGRGFAVYDKYIIIPRHYLVEWDQISTNAKMTIRCYQQPDITINYNQVTHLFFKYRELCVIRVPTFVPRKKMIHHFCSHERWSKPRATEVKIVAIDEDFEAAVEYNKSTLHRNFCLNDDDGNKLAVLEHIIQYQNRGKGKCMQVLQDSQGFIIGFHVAGNERYGFAEPVVKESFEQLITSVQDFEQDPELLSGEPQMARMQLDGVFERIGTVKPEYVRWETGKTQILPSKLHGIYPAKTMPVPLKPCEDNNYTSPLRLGCEKHGIPSYGFDARVLDVAAQRFTEQLIAEVEPVNEPVRKWSEEEAVNGVGSTPGFGRLVMSTSEGFPYCFERPPNCSGKEWLLKPKEETPGTWTYDFHPRLREILDKKTQLRREGIVPQTIFIDCLKDERLPILKAKTPGKARIFSVSPLDFLIQYRQNFADFTIAFIRNSENMHHSIGIAAESLDWTVLARNLQSRGTKILCGDYSNFGPGFAIDVHEKVTQAKLMWYAQFNPDPAEQLEREILCREVENAVHLCQDLLYQLMCGHPSGAPDTAEKNSMVNILYIYYAWIIIWRHRDAIMAQFHMMLKHIWFTTYGDDLIINVSDEAAVWFNNVELQKVFAALGIRYTDDSKSDTIRPWCTLSEATFLKRHFIAHPTRKGVICGALDKLKLEDIPLWIRKSEDPVEATRLVAVQTLLLAHGWGIEYFNNFRSKLMKAWQERVRDPPLVLATWEEVDTVYYGNTTEPLPIAKFYAEYCSGKTSQN